MKNKATGTASVSVHGTDWDRLRKLDDRQIRRGLKADAEVCPTDANFWKTAKVVLPQRDDRRV